MLSMGISRTLPVSGHMGKIGSMFLSFPKLVILSSLYHRNSLKFFKTRIEELFYRALLSS